MCTIIFLFFFVYFFFFFFNNTATTEIYTLSLHDALPISGSTELPTIAVLRFASVSAEQESDLFADGLTDEVITDLSMIKTLRVISRQSAMRLKGSDKDMRTIARELGARYVLTGTIRRAGSSLRVT